MRRLPTEQLFTADLEPIGDDTLNMRIDALERAFVSDPAGTLPSCPLSQLEALEAV